MKKVLVIRFSSIGDVVLTSPVVRVLKNKGFHVSVITKKGFRVLWQENPFVDDLILVEDFSSEILSLLKEKQFDVVVDLHNNSWAKKIKSNLGVDNYTLSKSNINKALLVWTKMKVFGVTHIVSRYLDTIKPLVGEIDVDGLDFFEAKPSETILPILKTKYAVFVIGGQHKGKMMTEARMIEFCKEFKYKLLLLGGPEDKVIGDNVAHKSGDLIVNYAGKLSLMDSVNILKHAHFVISHDTGLMHIASAYKRNIISLWGATSPELGFSPYKPGMHSVVLEEPHILRPTSKLGKQRVFSQIDYIDRIPLDKIFSECDKLWDL